MDLNLQKLTREQAAQLLGVGPKSVELYTKQVEDPLTFRHNEGEFKYYIWSEVLAWRLRRELRKIPAKALNTKDNLADAKLEGQNLANEKLQLEIDVRKEQLLEAEDVRKTWSDALVSIRQSLLNVGHVAATDIVDGMSHAKKKKVIDELVFTNLSKVIEDAQAGTEAKP